MNQTVNKQKLIAYLIDMLNGKESVYGFTDNDGWNQVKGKGEEINRAYGEYDAIHQLWTELQERDIKSILHPYLITKSGSAVTETA